MSEVHALPPERDGDRAVISASSARDQASGRSPSRERAGEFAIRVRHVWHRFAQFDVLRDVSFDVGHGEVFGFIGPNGAGKTTTIRMMATLLEPMSGRIEINGMDVTRDPEAIRKLIGYMPDHAGIYERVSVREYLEFFAEAYDVPPGSVVKAALELTDLTSLEDKLVATMSKGQKQRLQLARVLLHDPNILILDEPASDLDPRARIEIRNLLSDLRGLGKTILLSSHILTELADVCTSVGILERGRLVVAGPISEIGARLEAQRYAEAHGSAVAAPGPQVSAGGAPPGVAPPLVPVGPSLRRVKFRILGDPNYVAAQLAGLRGVHQVEVVGGLLVLSLSGPESVIADVVGFLVSRQIGVVGVEQERNELERIFLEVTRGEMQ